MGRYQQYPIKKNLWRQVWVLVKFTYLNMTKLPILTFRRCGVVVNSIKKNNNIDNFYIYPIPPPIGFLH
jgi:hypothetical protein